MRKAGSKRSREAASRKRDSSSGVSALLCRSAPDRQRAADRAAARQAVETAEAGRPAAGSGAQGGLLGSGPVAGSGESPPDAAESLARGLLKDSHRQKRCEAKGSADLALSVPGLSRFRVNVYRQRDNPVAACRVLSGRIPRWTNCSPTRRERPR